MGRDSRSAAGGFRNRQQEYEDFAEGIWSAAMRGRREAGLREVDFQEFYEKNKSWILQEWTAEQRSRR